LAQFESIVNISVTLVLVIYLMSIAAYFKILWKGQELTRLRAFLGMMALFFVLWALYAAGWKIVLGSMLLMGFGYPLKLRQACKP
jgi:APA family basic amino acid/polyamine antiporter